MRTLRLILWIFCALALIAIAAVLSLYLLITPERVEKQLQQTLSEAGYTIRMNEPAIDLGIVMAIVSSFRNRPVDEKTIVFGEVGLSGEVRAVNMPEQRVAEAKKLGFETCILPEVSLKMVKGIKGIKLVGVKNIGDAVREI